jgi:hypothetical protein
MDDDRPRLVLVPKDPEPDRRIGQWRLHRPELTGPLHATRPFQHTACPEVDIFISDEGYFDMQARDHQVWGLIVPAAVVVELLADAKKRGASLDAGLDEDEDDGNTSP